MAQAIETMRIDLKQNVKNVLIRAFPVANKDQT